MFWGSLLLRCGDVESNPGPTLPNQKEPQRSSMRQTRITSGRTASTDRAGSTPDSGQASPLPSQDFSQDSALPSLTLTDIMTKLQAMESTMKTIPSIESKLDEVKQGVDQLRKEYSDLKQELKGLSGEVVQLKKENQELQTVNANLTEKLADCEKRIDDLEGRSKRNNIIVYGLPRQENETPADCEGLLRDLITDKLELADRVELDRVHRLNSKPDSPVIACFTFYRQKVKVLKAKNKLKGTNTFIGEDFSRSVRDIRRRLGPHLKKARQEGKRATMVFDHLLIEGNKYYVDGRDNLVQLR